MKKLTAMLLALTLCFGLAACGGNTAQDDTKDESQTVQTGKTEDKKDEAKTEEKSDESRRPRLRLTIRPRPTAKPRIKPTKPSR